MVPGGAGAVRVRVQDFSVGDRAAGPWTALEEPEVTGRLVALLAEAYGIPVRMIMDAWMRTRQGEQAPVPAIAAAEFVGASVSQLTRSWLRRSPPCSPSSTVPASRWLISLRPRR